MLTIDDLRESTEAFFFDSEEERERKYFPQDFADWLRSNSGEREADEFLEMAKDYLRTAEKPRLEGVIQLARDYANVIEYNEWLEDEEPVDWSREADVLWDRESEVEHRLDNDTPVRLNDDDPDLACEYPQVVVHFPRGETVDDLAARAIVALMGEDVRGARRFVQDASQCMRVYNEATAHDVETLLYLVMSYVTVIPIVHES